LIYDVVAAIERDPPTGEERLRRTMENTDIDTTRKCAHEECRCSVPLTEDYCSDHCSVADDVAEVELQCNCGHPSCGLE
jgi:hypothetical protein